MRDLEAEARRVLAGNRLHGTSGWGKRSYDFVCPSPTRYPFQWFWDSAFHAIALLHVDPELSKRELRCLLQGLQPDGFMPHMILWEKDAHAKARADYLIRMADPYFTATIQPPVLARAIERVYKTTGDAAFVRETVPGVLRFFRWLRERRDPDQDGLISILQPDESGLDCSPKYDAAMGIVDSPRGETAPSLLRGMRRLFEAYDGKDPARLCELDVFNWEDVMMNSIYADGLSCLARLCPVAGLPAADAAELETLSARTLAALQEKCWDAEAGAFWDLSGKREERVRVRTFTSLFPLILPGLDPAIAKTLIDEHLLNPRQFWLEYPIPSVAADEPTFDPDNSSRALWRGPSWVNANWYLYWGLRAHARPEVASELARRTFAMVSRGGIREYFNPRTAEGYGAADFGWTCLVLDLLAAEGST